MIETSPSLLNRLRTAAPNSPDWTVLYNLYRPFIVCWARRAFLQDADANDMVQEVFTELRKAIPTFEYDQTKGKFRSWLRVVFCNQLRKFRRSRQNRERGLGGDDGLAVMEQLEDANSELSEIWERDHDRHVLRQLQTMIRPEFSDKAWKAFDLRVHQGLPGEVVAQKLGMKRGTVDVYKSMILNRLRKEAKHLIDTE
jgi:RNA polymerase sigma factor (sigma-70 family)